MSETTRWVLFGFEVVILALALGFSIATYQNTNYDRRDVNRDGQVNLVDLSVLAVEISEANEAK